MNTNFSAHGIPRAYVSQGLRRTLWLLLFLFCFCAFGYQAYLIVLRFHRNDIIVGVEIRFEELRFPAVTICNINPYKNSLARQAASIKNALESFEFAIDRSSGSEISQAERKKRYFTGLFNVSERRVLLELCSGEGISDSDLSQ
uniref:Acid-sensing ion channel 1 n=1 Tax=Angiostrongylus cantonensis TaxID=6313 RepID=A0A0K0DMM8_ANGCA